MTTRFFRTPQSEDVEYAPRQRRTIQELRRLHSRPESPTAVVYYVQRGDGAIKVGTSDHLAARLRHLRSSHGPLQLLATERGSFTKEEERHTQFADDALGGEWFSPSPALMAHVETLAGGAR